jgi:DNA helicase-2/ATP-dependent DNA helicase PcrA
MDSPELLEEERRLCYVGMTRAQKRLVLSWAKYRRRFGGGEQERSTPSWFLGEVPEKLLVNLGPEEQQGEVDLTGERYDVRQAARRNMYTGRTYNSLENISQFFSERGIAFNSPRPAPPPKPLPRQAPVIPPRPSLPIKPPPAVAPLRRIARTGMTVEHPKYGKGTVVRREGDGENAKITVNFPHHGLKKLVEKYAGLKRD